LLPLLAFALLLEVDSVIQVCTSAAYPVITGETYYYRIAFNQRKSIGRSAVMAACILVMLGMTANDALHRVAQVRGCPVPDTPEQRAWVEQFAQSYTNFMTPRE
jgi:hypothetical protein